MSIIRVRKGETDLAFAHRVAEAEGWDLDDYALDYVLWEHTGYPGFSRRWRGETDAGCLARQLRQALRRMPRAL